MEFNLLVDEILARVSQHLAGMGDDKSPAIDKEKILILTDQHGVKCHELLENSNLQKYYHVDCALQNEYDCDLQSYKAVVIYNLSIDVLSKLASGICDTPFLGLASRAILMGKKIFVPTEEIELYQYKQSSPSAYYSMMNEKLKLLRASGVIFCQLNEIEKLIMEGNKNQTCTTCEYKNNEDVKSATICKKIITEGDIKKIVADGVTKICIANNAILTDLAKDYIRDKKLQVEKESSTDGKLRKGL